MLAHTPLSLSFTYERKYVLLFLRLAYLLNSVILRSIHFAQMSSFRVWKHSIEYMCHVLVFCSCVGGHLCWSSSVAPVRGAAAGPAVCTFVVHWYRGFPVQTKREVYLGPSLDLILAFWEPLRLMFPQCYITLHSPYQHPFSASLTRICYWVVFFLCSFLVMAILTAVK